MSKNVMAGICPRCGDLLVRPVPCDHAVCDCVANPKPVLVRLNFMRVLASFDEARHPKVTLALRKRVQGFAKIRKPEA